jgi:putative hydrolase of the HAD superfamily
MKFEAVIFDLFGTLVDDFGSSIGEMNTELAATLGITPEPFIRVWGQTAQMRIIGDFQTVEDNIEYVCRVMDVRASGEQVSKAVEIRMKYIRQALRPRPNAVDTLTQLKKEGYKIGLISNASIEIAILWHETAFAGLVDSPVFSSRERLKKPDVRIYNLAYERLGVTPGSCLYIGDGEDHELAGAANVGLHPVLIRITSHATGRRSHEEARQWQGPTISSLTEVLQLVRA